MPWDFQQEPEPATWQELAGILQTNSQAARLPVFPIGGGTTLENMPGQAINAIGLHTRNLTQVIDYPARDLTITVEAGMRIDQLNEILQAESQCLPIDISQSDQATIGGVLASNTSGPHRFHHGTARDFVLGLSVVDAAGQLFKSGGRVVKNVAGYDMHKLMIGSVGTLGVITQVTLKLKPMPETRPLLWSSFHTLDDIDLVLERLLTSETRPVALDVLNPRAAKKISEQSNLACDTEHPVLCIGYEGTTIETNWQISTIKQELAPFGPESMLAVQNEQSDALWNSLTNFKIDSQAQLTLEASVLPSRSIELMEQATRKGLAVQSHAGNGVVIGHRDGDTPDNDAIQTVNTLRTLARAAGGFVRILKCAEDCQVDLSHEDDAQPSWKIMQAIKSALDPDGLMNPDRQFTFLLPVG